MLSRRDIEKELGKGINIVPFYRENIKENSVNLTASMNAWTRSSGTVCWYGGTDFRLEDTNGVKRKYTIGKGKKCIFTANKGKGDERNYIILFPHSTTLVETQEVLGIGNNIGGALHSKVGLVSKGIGHIGTMLGPGFCGHLLIALHNVTDRILSIEVGTTFVSLTLDYLTTQVVRTSSTTSGHVDKFSELGITIDERLRNELTADWKSNIDSIRERMLEEDSYIQYKKHIKGKRWEEVKKYINKRNIYALLGVIILVVILHFSASFIDSKLETPILVERLWNVGFSGIAGSLVMAFWNFLKDKK